MLLETLNWLFNLGPSYFHEPRLEAGDGNSILWLRIEVTPSKPVSRSWLLEVDIMERFPRA